MFGPVLDVVIGLVFTIVIYAALLSAVVELVAGVLKLRARALEGAVIRMLEDPTLPTAWFARCKAWATGIFGRYQVAVRSSAPKLPPVDAHPLSAGLRYQDVYHHPYVAGPNRQKRPSYITAEDFASALLFVLRRGMAGSPLEATEQSVRALPAGGVRDALLTIVEEARGDAAAIKAGIERWYDSTMDRLNGDYKRFTQLLTFILGVCMAVTFNVDAVNVVNRLYAEPGLRSALAGQAERYVESAANAPTPLPDLSSRKAAVDKASALLLETSPVGWNGGDTDFAAAYAAKVDGGARKAWAWFDAGLQTYGPHGLGWLLMAAAGMLGAPFWFDLLSKLVNIRSTGPRPAPRRGAA